MGIFLKAADSFKHIQEMMQRERFYVQKSMVTKPNRLELLLDGLYCFFVSSLYFVSFFVSCFFYSMYLLYLKLFLEKLVAVSILNLSSVINFPPLKDILPVYSLPFLLADMHCNCKVALPLVCRCQVLQTKKSVVQLFMIKILCIFIFLKQQYIIWSFPCQ